MINNSHALFISHGGGPMPLLEQDVHHLEMVSCLKEISSSIEKPSAIILISGHWEENIPTITYGKNPPLIYDYYGFPEETYSIQYPCPGNPDLAEQVHQSLEDAGIESKLDAQRGYDHGVFVPLKIMYPHADIPCIEISLLNSLDPDAHIKVGQAFQNLDYDNLLIIGSGFSFHNMKAMQPPTTNETLENNQAFENWLIETCSSDALSEDERTQRLINWAIAPGGRFCHPREEHLLPLHVCYGAAGQNCSKVFELEILEKKCSMYLWE